MNLLNTISKILYYAIYKINNLSNLDKCKKLEKRILGNHGIYKNILQYLKNNKKLILYKQKIFLHLNTIQLSIKQRIIHKINLYKNQLNNHLNYIDLSLPGRTIKLGNLHPITININNIKQFFFSLGFDLIDGPEIENCFYNFDALNIKKTHPARSDKDSFWIKKDKYLLRTHTTSVQIRFIKNKKPPFKYFTIGKVFRYDHDTTHTPMFHQLEGLIVDTKVNLCNLKELINNFLSYYFNNMKFKLRFRPSYFPFTVPSIEVDIFNIKYNKWLEILGCGLLHYKVLNSLCINPDKYNALAFGIGIERLIMLKYNLTDLRILFENNLRFLTKFKYIQ